MSMDSRVKTVTDETLDDMISRDLKGVTAEEIVFQLEESVAHGWYCDLHPVEAAHILKRLRAAEKQLETMSK